RGHLLSVADARRGADRGLDQAAATRASHPKRRPAPERALERGARPGAAPCHAVARTLPGRRIVEPQPQAALTVVKGTTVGYYLFARLADELARRGRREAMG